LNNNYFPRTDLAMESYDSSDGKLPEGVLAEEKRIGSVVKTTVKIETEDAAKRLRRSCGNYITLEGDFSLYSDILKDELQEELSNMLPEGPSLVVGLGNREITPDIIGPVAASQIMATRHLFSEQLERMGLEELRSVCVISPGVMGQTGLDVMEVVAAVLKKEHFCSVIAIDALAARSAGRLGSTIQLCNSGISPGSGVMNRRGELSEKTLGIPVIAIGIPTVIDAATLISDECPDSCTDSIKSMMVTPRNIDSVAEQGSKIISRAVNKALQPFLTDEELDIFMN